MVRREQKKNVNERQIRKQRNYIKSLRYSYTVEHKELSGWDMCKHYKGANAQDGLVQKTNRQNEEVMTRTKMAGIDAGRFKGYRNYKQEIKNGKQKRMERGQRQIIKKKLSRSFM